MKLYLVRHAQAEDGSPDFERRLTEAGRERSRVLGKWLEPWLEDARILTSPAARARETAEILCQRIRFGGALEHEPLLYGGSLSAIARVIWGCKEPALVLVGHDPTLSELASELVWNTPSGIELKKGGVVRVDLSQGRGTLRWLLDPRLLERGGS